MESSGLSQAALVGSRGEASLRASRRRGRQQQGGLREAAAPRRERERPSTAEDEECLPGPRVLYLPRSTLRSYSLPPLRQGHSRT